MEELGDLFLELANGVRLRILFQIEKESLNLTQISNKLDLSVPETSRHLSRLRATKLIKKNNGNIYCLTPYGNANLRLLLGHFFLVKNSDYFINHSLSTIPQELLYRIGEMESSIRVKEFMKVVRLIELSIQRAEQEIRLMSDQMLVSGSSTIAEKVANGVQFKCLLPEDYIPPPGFKPITHGNVERSTLKEMENFVLLTDREAVVAFTDSSGKIDYNEAFHVQEAASRKWCKDLFEYFWKRSEHNKMKLPA